MRSRSGDGSFCAHKSDCSPFFPASAATSSDPSSFWVTWYNAAASPSPSPSVASDPPTATECFFRESIKCGAQLGEEEGKSDKDGEKRQKTGNGNRLTQKMICTVPDGSNSQDCSRLPERGEEITAAPDVQMAFSRQHCHTSMSRKITAGLHERGRSFLPTYPSAWLRKISSLPFDRVRSFVRCPMKGSEATVKWNRLARARYSVRTARSSRA